MGLIKVAIVGIGNCASALLQGIEYYRNTFEDQAIGLLYPDIGGYKPGDIEVVAAFDIDARKVNQPLGKAALAYPNCTKIVCNDLSRYGVIVSMGPVMDGIAPHMENYPEERRFIVSDTPATDVTGVLQKSGAEVLINYLPVGSEEATRFYADCCLKAGVSLVNCMPVFIASDSEWAGRFFQKGIPIIGDDVKSQMGATIIHRLLAKLFVERGVKLDRTYQLNVGGNTDFLNMLNQNRLRSKRISKTEAVQSQLDIPLEWDNIHIGPSDYVPWQLDNKVCFLRMEGRGFAGVPLELELRLSVEDSPNSGGVVIDAIRCCKLARDRGISGPLLSVSAYTMKHPPQQYPDHIAHEMLTQFIRGERER